jgi:hypothetical protein
VVYLIESCEATPASGPETLRRPVLRVGGPASFVERHAVAGEAGGEDCAVGSYSDRHQTRHSGRPLWSVPRMGGDAHRQWGALIAVVGAAGDEVAWPQHPGRERTGLVHRNEAVALRFEMKRVSVRSGEAELVDERHLRPPETRAAEVDRLSVHAAGDLEVPGGLGRAKLCRVKVADLLGRPGRVAPETGSGDWAAGVVGLWIRDEAGLGSDRRTGLGGIRHVAAGRIAFEMEERAPAAPLGQCSEAESAFTYDEHSEVCRHRDYRPKTWQLNSEHSASRNQHDRHQRRKQPPLSCTPLRLRHQRIEREGQARNVQRHSTIIASTTA